MKDVLFASFESLPFIKTGGLADVVYALPKAIDNKKYKVKVVLPLFKKIKEKYYASLKFLTYIDVNSGLLHEGANVYSYINENIEYFFIENDNFYNRDGVYGYDDDVKRFSFFNVAILEMLIKLDYYPDIIHSHDYHTGVISALCKLRYNSIEKIRNIKHIYTIHNLAFQGIYDKQILFDYLCFDYNYYLDGKLRYNDCCNFMKIGIVMADAVTTVSKTYAKEIQTIEYGETLEGVLSYRKDDLYGIVNGIDDKTFNPLTDDIKKNYSLENYKEAKKINKLALQKELGLKQDPDCMLVGMISRLTNQKGADLICSIYERLLNKNVQIAILGTGDYDYENAFKYMEGAHKGKAVYYCGYNEKLAHSMYAGLDMLLMPSKFEPCGISQLIAMHYGTLPLVRETGGLKDTVEPYDCYKKQGRGFTFGPFNSEDLYKVFEYAYDQFMNNKADWDMMIENAMKYNVSFTKSAKEYEKLYKKVLTC